MTNNIHYLKGELSEEEILPITEEIKRIEKDFSKAINYNSKLIQNIEQEYEIIDNFLYIQKILRPHIKKFCKSETIKPILIDTWVNFQKKHEYSPLHYHQGDIGFVIYIQVPFTNEEEELISPGRNSRYCSAGNFQFVGISDENKVSWKSIRVDKSFENKFLIFPSDLCHIVYPFFSSDEYRIGVSGNFKI
jgi:hypothetical protein